MTQLMPLQLTVSCFSKIQIGFTFLVPADLHSPGKRAVTRVCVCLVSLVRWNEVCLTASFAIQELLRAWQNGTINSEKITVC